MSKIKITINGQEQSLEVPEDKPLLWVLREDIGLTGTKYGCGIAQCGACTVHLDGKPIRSCVLPSSAIGDSKITTIEGIDQNHALIKAWKEINVPQCGYCQTGQIMSAISLLENKYNPTDEDINTAMDGNICRCGTYYRIRQAIKKAFL